MNIQVASDLDGRVAAVGPTPVHGARHDPHVYQASGLKDLHAAHDTAADLGYTGVDGIRIVPLRRPAEVDPDLPFAIAPGQAQPTRPRGARSFVELGEPGAAITTRNAALLDS